MIILKDDYFIYTNAKGNYRKYIHFDNIFSITLVPSIYQGKTYDEAQKEYGKGFWHSFLENKIKFESIYTPNVDSDLIYGPNPEDILECNTDFERIVEAHAKYMKNKKNV